MYINSWKIPLGTLEITWGHSYITWCLAKINEVYIILEYFRWVSSTNSTVSKLESLSFDNLLEVFKKLKFQNISACFTDDALREVGFFFFFFFLSRREPFSKELCVVCAQSLSHVWLFVTPWTVAPLAPLSMGFSRQEYWNRLPFSPPGDLPNPGIKTTSPAPPASAGGFFTTEPPGKSREPRSNSFSITFNLWHPFRNVQNSPLTHLLSYSALTQVWWRLSKWYCWPWWVGPDGQSSL